MGIWGAIKKALNSTVGTSDFLPLDTVIGNKITTAKDTVVSDISALQTHLEGGNVPIIRHIQRGYSTTESSQITITLSGFSNLDKMFVLLNGGGAYSSSFFISACVESLSLTQLKIHTGSSSLNNRGISYQVIELY